MSTESPGKAPCHETGEPAESPVDMKSLALAPTRKPDDEDDVVDGLDNSTDSGAELMLLRRSGNYEPIDDEPETGEEWDGGHGYGTVNSRSSAQVVSKKKHEADVVDFRKALLMVLTSPYRDGLIQELLVRRAIPQLLTSIRVIFTHAPFSSDAKLSVGDVPSWSCGDHFSRQG
jgi:hypothetical protein